jgi:hypothetical protein
VYCTKCKEKRKKKKDLHIVAAFQLKHNMQTARKKKAQDAHIYAALKMKNSLNTALSASKVVPAVSNERRVANIEREHTLNKSNAVRVIQARHTKRKKSLMAKISLREYKKKCAALKKCAMFSSLSDESINKFVDKLEYEKFFHGEVICSQGDKADVFYLIARGSCDVVVDGEQVATLKEDDFFGESALFSSKYGVNKAVRSATVSVSLVDENLDGMLVQQISGEQFMNLIRIGVFDAQCIKKMDAVMLERAQINSKKLGKKFSSVTMRELFAKRRISPPMSGVVAAGAKAAATSHSNLEDLRLLISKVIHERNVAVFFSKLAKEKGCNALTFQLFCKMIIASAKKGGRNVSNVDVKAAWAACEKTASESNEGVQVVQVVHQKHLLAWLHPEKNSV